MQTSDLIKSAKRELAMRKNVYSKKVQEGRLKQEVADHELTCMSEIATVLERLESLKPETFSTLYDFLNKHDAPSDVFAALEKLELAVRSES
jgi:hypothetical protein